MRSWSFSNAAASAVSSATIFARPLPCDDPHPCRRAERASWDHRAELDELAGGNVERPQQHLRAEELHVAPHVDRVAPGLEHLAGSDLGRRQAVERLLPLRAPHLEVDVDDVVVGHREASHAVVHGEGAELVGGAVVPDDAEGVAHPGRSVRAGGVDAAELGAASRAVGAAVLGDADAVDRLAGAKRDVAIAAAERPAERVGDVLVDEQAAVLRDLHRDAACGSVNDFAPAVPAIASAASAAARRRRLGRRRRRRIAGGRSCRGDRRFRGCRSSGLEADRRHLAVGGVLDLEELAPGEAERARRSARPGTPGSRC